PIGPIGPHLKSGTPSVCFRTLGVLFFTSRVQALARPSSPGLPRGPEESSLKGELPPDPPGVQALVCQAAEKSRKISPKSHLKAELPPDPLGVQALACQAAQKSRKIPPKSHLKATQPQNHTGYPR